MEGRQKPVKNELFTIGPLTVYGYGAMIALGVIAAWIVTECRARKLRLSSDHVFALVLWGLLGGLVCAKLLYWITEWDSVMKDPGFLLDTLTDGFVVYGGIIGGILAGLGGLAVCLQVAVMEKRRTVFWRSHSTNRSLHQTMCR